VDDKPLPTPDKANTRYWQGCREHVLLLPNCNACAATWFPPAPNCPSCLSDDIGWKEASGRGRLWSWNVFHQAYFAGFTDDIPYVTALIELEEGPRMTSTVVDVALADLRCDLEVEVAFDDVTDEFSLPTFRPAGGS
jgi:uncharacterized OB-fold protein